MQILLFLKIISNLKVHFLEKIYPLRAESLSFYLKLHNRLNVLIPAFSKDFPLLSTSLSYYQFDWF